MKKSKLVNGLMGLTMSGLLACGAESPNGPEDNGGYTQPQQGNNCTVVRDPVYIVRDYENEKGEMVFDEILEKTKGLRCNNRDDMTRIPTAYGDTINVVNHKDNICGDKKYGFSIIRPYTDKKQDKYAMYFVQFPNPNGPCKENE